MKGLSKDPLNILVAGVGGQGNVMLAQVMGQALVKEGYFAVVGDSFGASQRGGSVASHVRVSKDTEYSSTLPRGSADFIVGMEPSETLRALGSYGNPKTQVIMNPRIVYPPTVISGADTYPEPEELMANIKKYSGKMWLVPATEKAMEMGNRMMANTILLGAIVGTGILPIRRETIVEILKERFANPKVFESNIKALDLGIGLTKAA
jgi:indolepyruvate ferredoxin oxidoreductase, beta subunit